MTMSPYPRSLERWPLLLAFALAAMTAAHAFELALENSALFGDGRAAYTHFAQGPAVDLSVALFLFSIAVLGSRLVRGARAIAAQSDWILPALQEIRAMGNRGAALRIIAMQIPAWLAVEFVEQRLSGIAQPSLAAVFGHGHVTAPFIQCAVGLILAWALVATSRTVCDHAAQLVRAVQAVTAVFVARIPRPSANSTLREIVSIDARRPKRRLLLALRLANRPPPAIAAARA
jgi:hypothetical protein